MTHKPWLNILIVVGLLALPLALGQGPAAQAAPEAGTLYVQPGASGGCTSWGDACELQTALNLATPGDEIWVAQGVYMPSVPAEPSATFQLKSGVELYGGFNPDGGADTFEERDWQSYPSVLSGDIDGNDITDPTGVVTDTENIQGENAYHVVTGSGVDALAILDGFTITGGNANTVNAPWNSGGGMYNNNGSPSVTNITFSGNRADFRGGGMYNDISSPTLANVAFSGNRAVVGGGGMYNIGSNPTLTDVFFSGNDADSGGGMLNGSSHPILTNVTFSGNSADWAGAMYNATSNPILTNVTFSGNRADWGGGMFNYDSSPTLTNAILWGNWDQIVNWTPSSTPVISYSNIQGSGGSGASWDTTLGSDGGGNIDNDPLFVRNYSEGGDGQWGTGDDDFGDLSLQPTSPAIDAGDNATVPTGVTTDLDGKPRFVDIPGVPDTGNGDPPIVDMGAYEAQNLIFLPIVKR